MYPVINQNSTPNATIDSLWDQVSHIPGTIESRLPTFDKSLDTYFDEHFATIIEEWDLVTESDLDRLENRLTRVSDEINRLYVKKMQTEARVHALDDLITGMEKSL